MTHSETDRTPTVSGPPSQLGLRALPQLHALHGPTWDSKAPARQGLHHCTVPCFTLLYADTQIPNTALQSAMQRGKSPGGESFVPTPGTAPTWSAATSTTGAQPQGHSWAHHPMPTRTRPTPPSLPQRKELPTNRTRRAGRSLANSSTRHCRCDRRCKQHIQRARSSHCNPEQGKQTAASNSSTEHRAGAQNHIPSVSHLHHSPSACREPPATPSSSSPDCSTHCTRSSRRCQPRPPAQGRLGSGQAGLSASSSSSAQCGM